MSVGEDPWKGHPWFGGVSEPDPVFTEVRDVIYRLHTIASGCVCAWMLCAPVAEATDGRITFSGSVVTPTCNVATDEYVPADSVIRSRQHFRQACAGHGDGTAMSQIRTMTTRRLTSAEPDRVLNYFDAYVRSHQADAVPTLITEIYE